MSDKEKLPIKFFATREIDELRVEPGGNDEVPKCVLSGEKLEKRLSQLLVNLDQFTAAVKEKETKQSAIPFLFIAKLCQDSTAKSRRKDVASLFQFKERNNVIGLSQADELIVRLDSYDEMQAVSNRLKDIEKSNFAISCLEGFFKFKPAIVDVVDQTNNYKVKLVDFQDYEKNLTVQRIFEKVIKEKGISFKKTDYSEHFLVYNLKGINKTVLDSLQKEEIYDALFSIEPMPKYVVSLDTMCDEHAVNIIQPRHGRNYVTGRLL